MQGFGMSLGPLAQGWRDSGLLPGDTMLLHSDSLRLSVMQRRKGLPSSPAFILDSFLEAIGPEGTLILPLFNFDFAKGIPFDFRNTKSHMGVVTEAARVHHAAVRTGHPIYSFAIIGAKAHHFATIDNFSGYGGDSPFALLRELDGKIGALDISDQRCMTFHHHVEEMCNVPYRYHKVFEGEYTDASGMKKIKKYGLFVRDLVAKIETWVEPMGEVLWKKGVWKGFRPGHGPGLRLSRAREVFNEVSQVIRRGEAEGLLYRYGVSE